MQRCTVYLYIDTALHVSGGTITHHQERIQLLLLPAHIAAGSSNGVTKDVVDTVVCAPDDGWWCHPKHVEQFPDINKLCNVASFWVYILEYTYDARTHKS